jgi:hypothetical protein
MASIVAGILFSALYNPSYAIKIPIVNNFDRVVYYLYNVLKYRPVA